MTVKILGLVIVCFMLACFGALVVAACFKAGEHRRGK